MQGKTKCSILMVYVINVFWILINQLIRETLFFLLSLMILINSKENSIFHRIINKLKHSFNIVNDAKVKRNVYEKVIIKQ